jgi:uncharacterized protein (TIGR03435 family)
MYRSSGLLTALFWLLAVVLAFAQPPKFEMADVHVSPTARTFGQNFGGVLRDGQYVNRDATMLKLIGAAYDVSEDNIAGGPGWITSDLFDVIAKVPAGTTLATASLMLQNLLAERFHLVIRNDTRPVPRYVLTVGKSGSKLKSAAVTRDEVIQQTLRTRRAIGSPGYPSNENEIVAVAGRAYDRGYDPMGVARQAVATVASGDRTERLRNLAVPTLVIHGIPDRMCDVSGERATAEAIPGAELVLIEGMDMTCRRVCGPRLQRASPNSCGEWSVEISAHQHLKA